MHAGTGYHAADIHKIDYVSRHVKHSVHIM